MLFHRPTSGIRGDVGAYAVKVGVISHNMIVVASLPKMTVIRQPAFFHYTLGKAATVDDLNQRTTSLTVAVLNGEAGSAPIINTACR